MNYYNNYKIEYDDFIIFINGNYILNDDIFFNLCSLFKKLSHIDILCPLIINKEKLIYAGGYIINNNFYYIDERLMPLSKINNNYSSHQTQLYFKHFFICKKNIFDTIGMDTIKIYNTWITPFIQIESDYDFTNLNVESPYPFELKCWKQYFINLKDSNLLIPFYKPGTLNYNSYDCILFILLSEHLFYFLENINYTSFNIYIYIKDYNNVDKDILFKLKSYGIWFIYDFDIFKIRKVFQKIILLSPNEFKYSFNNLYEISDIELFFKEKECISKLENNIRKKKNKIKVCCLYQCYLNLFPFEKIYEFLSSLSNCLDFLLIAIDNNNLNLQSTLKNTASFPFIYIKGTNKYIEMGAYQEGLNYIFKNNIIHNNDVFMILNETFFTNYPLYSFNKLNETHFIRSFNKKKIAYGQMVNVKLEEHVELDNNRISKYLRSNFILLNKQLLIEFYTFPIVKYKPEFIFKDKELIIKISKNIIKRIKSWLLNKRYIHLRNNKNAYNLKFCSILNEYNISINLLEIANIKSI